MNLLEITATIDAALITAVGVAIVAILTAYGTLQNHRAAGKAEEVAVTVEETHAIVNSQRTAMEALIKKLEGENAALREKE